MRRSNNGFSLVQIIISLGLLSGILLTAMKIAQNQRRLGQSSSFQFESINILDQIKNNLHSPQSCIHTFKGKNAYYDEVDTVYSYDLSRNRKNAIYEIKRDGLRPYGQEDVYITGIKLIGDQENFSPNNGYSLVRIEFIEDSLQAQKFTGHFPLRVSVDELGIITSCQSSVGITQSEDEAVAADPWVKADKDSTNSGIYYTQTPVVISDATPRGKLNIKSGLVVGQGRRAKSGVQECSEKNAYTLKFSDRYKSLMWCDGESPWRKLDEKGTLYKEKDSYEVSSQSSSLETFLTPKSYKFCVVKEARSHVVGQCWARLLKEGSRTSPWELVAGYYRGEKLVCKFDCFL